MRLKYKYCWWINPLKYEDFIDNNYSKYIIIKCCSNMFNRCDWNYISDRKTIYLICG